MDLFPKDYKKNSPTLKDIARKAGVSVTTVSQIIAGIKSNIPISSETKKGFSVSQRI